MSDYLRCPFCSTQVLEFMRFCPDCGSMLQAADGKIAPGRDLYDVLLVARKAKPDQIVDAYRRLISDPRPNISGPADEEDPTAAINHAFRILSDPDSRRRYDKVHRRSALVRPTGPRQAPSKPRISPVGCIQILMILVGVGYGIYESFFGPDPTGHSTPAPGIEPGRGTVIPATSGPTRVVSQNPWAMPASVPLPVFEPDPARARGMARSGEAKSLKRLAGGTDLFPLTPDTGHYEVRLYAQRKVWLAGTLCAAGADPLAEGLRHAKFAISIDGYEIPGKQLQVWRELKPSAVGGAPDLVCEYHGLVASHWPIGKHSIQEMLSLDAPVSNGLNSVASGTYYTSYTLYQWARSPDDQPTVTPSP